MAPTRPRFQQIQALRGLAALSVAAMHTFQWERDQLWIGAAGVDVFFVISGFIVWSVAVGGEATPGRFAWRRLTRVAPAYWLVTGLVAALAATWPRLLPQIEVTPVHLALSLAFISHIDPHGLPFPVLPPGWSLNYEAMFYGLVALVLFAPAAMRFGLLIAALGAIAAAGFLDPPLYGLGANMMLLQFAGGVWLAEDLRRGRRIPPAAGLLFAALGLAALTAMGITGFHDRLWRPLLWGAPALMIVAGAIAIEPVRSLRPPPWLASLGDASYAVYLCHFPAIDLVARLVDVRQPWAFAPAALAVSLAAGLAFHRFVELPLIAASRRLPNWRGGPEVHSRATAPP